MSKNNVNVFIGEGVFVDHCKRAEEEVKHGTLSKASHDLASGCNRIGRDLVRQIDKEVFNDKEKSQQVTQDIVNIFSSICARDYKVSAPTPNEEKEHLEQIIERTGIAYGILSGVAIEAIAKNTLSDLLNKLN